MFNAAIWCKKYNKGYKTQDPTKKPVILYLTLENTENETLKRAVTYAEGNSVNFNKMTPDRLYEDLLLSGYIDKNEDDLTTPEIMIMYRPNKSVTVRDIGVIMDDLNKSGKEVIFLCVDYIKRIRSQERNKELRIELGSIADDLCTLAKERNIPILTAMQLNREAIKTLTDTDHKSLADILTSAKQVGSSNVSESIDIIQNVDCAFTVMLYNDKTVDDTTNVVHIDRYLIIREVAVRFTKTCETTLMAHRFEQNNGMRLVEDVNLPDGQYLSLDEACVQQRINSGANIKTRSNRY